MPTVLQEITAVASTNAYQSLLKCRVPERTRCTLVLTNSHGTNDLKFKFLVSNSSGGVANSWAEEKGETTLAALSSTRYVLTGVFCWLDIQIIDSSSGNHATANVWVMAVGL